MTEPVSRIETLLKLAGERDQPSPEASERARAAARISWERARQSRAAPTLAGTRHLGAGWRWAAAAGVAAVAVATLALWPRSPAVAPMELARVSAVQGEVRAATAPVSLSSVLHDGDVISTGEGRVALAVGDALSLRMDRQTRLRLDGTGAMTLIEGAIYVDSGGLNAHTALRIDTPAGAVRHLGTQFQVRVTAGATRVQVREGRVVLASAGERKVDLAAGDAAEAASGRVQVVHGLPAYGSAWEWAAATAPAFDIENRPLGELLAWLAREHGWQVRFASASAQSRAQDIRLHGSLNGLDAAEILERTALVTGVTLSARDGVLHVETAP